MKYAVFLFIFTFCLFFFSTTINAAPNCNYTINSGTAIADGKGNFSQVQPGDTVCIAAGNRAGLKLINFKGSSSAPITFINSGGKVVINAGSSNGGIGISLYGSQHVRITGTGDSANQYGIEITNAGNSAVDTNHIGSGGNLDGTEYVEFDHIYAYSQNPGATPPDLGAGFRTAKNNDLLDTGIVWTGHQFYIHDNYIKTTSAEAMYIGTSDTHGSFPIYDVQVWNNKIEDAGYDGIQIRQAHTKVLVHHNYINGTGRDPRKNGTIDNTAGFNIAKGTDIGDWYSNTVIGARLAFMIKDSANIKVYNNLVIDSGHTTAYTPAEGAVQIYNANNIQFKFNTIVNTSINGTYGIDIKGSSGSVQNNIVGGSFSSLISGSGMTINNNLTNNSISGFNFKNSGSADFHLNSSSPAVNSASSDSSVNTDFDGVSRPQGSGYDVGAFEYGGSAPPSNPTVTSQPLPTPTTDNRQPTTISCNRKSQGDANCDGVVNGIDYSLWLNSQCDPGAGQACTTLRADFNGDGIVDDGDLLIWRNNRT